VIEELITRLIQQAPALDRATLEELRAALWANGTPLALAIGRIVELVGDDLVDPGIALPALAEACATLVDCDDARALDAARFRVDTLQPKPDPPVRIAAPDVPVSLVRPRRT